MAGVLKGCGPAPFLDIRPPTANHGQHANADAVRIRAFPPEALDANRQGELTQAQRAAFAGLLRQRNNRATIIAALLFVVAVLFGFLAPAVVAPVWRIAIIGVALGIAVSLVLRILTGGDRDQVVMLAGAAPREPVA